MTYKSRWEPTAQDLVNSFMKWLMTNPSPSWIISDAGPQFTSETFLDFCSRSGIGVMTAPAEAHWIMGAEEGCINILKSSVRRLLKEEPELTIAHAFALAAHGANHTIGPSGFSAFQWVRGGASPQEELPSGLDPKTQESIWRTTATQREGKDSFRTRTCQVQAVSPQQCSWKVASILQSWIPGYAMATEDQAGQDNRSLGWSCTSPTTRREHTMSGTWSNAHPGQDQPMSRMHATRGAPGNSARSCDLSPSRDDGQPSKDLHGQALHQCHWGKTDT